MTQAGRNDIVVRVDWADAWIDTQDFTRVKGEKMKPVYRSTVGFLVAETEEGIVLATDKYAKDKDGFAAPMFIPWGMVKEWYDV